MSLLGLVLFGRALDRIFNQQPQRNEHCCCCHGSDYEYSKKSDGWDHFEKVSAGESSAADNDSALAVDGPEEDVSTNDSALAVDGPEESSSSTVVTQEQKESIDNAIDNAFSEPAGTAIDKLKGQMAKLYSNLNDERFEVKSIADSFFKNVMDSADTYTTETKDDGTEVSTRTSKNGAVTTVEKSTDGTTTVTQTSQSFDIETGNYSTNVKKSVTNSDGSKTITKTKDGVEIYRNEINADGSYTVTKNGEVTEKLEIKDDGTKVKTSKGTLLGNSFNQVEETYTDGSSKRTRTYSDGSSYLKEIAADGSYTITNTASDGSKTITTYKDGITTTINYSSDGAELSKTVVKEDGSQIVTTNDSSGGATIEEIDKNGKTTKKTQTTSKGRETVTTYSYNDNGKLESESTSIDDGALESSVKYSYDSQGRVSTEDHGDWYYKYEYDSQGRITTRRRINHGDPIPEEKIEYTYNSDGTVTYKKTDANGSNLAWNWTTTTGTTTYDDVNDINEHVKNGK